MIPLLLALLVLIVIGMPVAFALGVGTLGVLIADPSLPLTLVPQRMFTALDSWPIMAVPLFMLAANYIQILDVNLSFLAVLLVDAKITASFVTEIFFVDFIGMLRGFEIFREEVFTADTGAENFQTGTEQERAFPVK